MKEQASITRSTFSTIDVHSTGHILAAVVLVVIIEMLFEFVCQWKFQRVALEDVLSE